MVLYLLYKIGISLSLSLPISISYKMASLFASIFCAVSPKDLAAVKANLRMVLGPDAGEDKVDALARGVFRNFAKYLVDFFRSSLLDEDYIRHNVRIDGVEHLKAAMGHGRGVVLLSAHIGNWELGGAALSLSGFEVNAVVLTHQNRKIDELFTSHRMMGNVKPIGIGPTLKACYKVLKANGLVALLGDRDFSKSGIRAEFFGRTAVVPKGPAVFGYRQGAAIVPTFMVREADDTFRLIMSKPHFADKSLDEDESVKGLAGLYLRDIECCIRQYPDQWYVFRYLWSEHVNGPLRPDTVL